MNLEGDAFFEPDRVVMLEDTNANNYQECKYKGNQMTQLDAEHKDNKGKKGTWRNKCKVQTEGVVPKCTHRTSYTPKDIEDRKLVPVCVFLVYIPIIC